MKTKKFLSIVLAGAIAASVFTGCSGGTDNTDKDGKAVISIGAWPMEGNPQYEAYQKKKADFEKENPDIKIKEDSWTFDLKSFYPKAESGMLPTLYNCNYTEMQQIKKNGYASDISKVLSKRGYDGKFNEKILDIISDGDGIYAFPQSAYTLGLCFRTDMFEKAGLMNADGTPKQPKDWYELAEFAVKIKEATGMAGFALPSTNNCGGWLFTPIAWSFGVDFMKKDSDGKWKATFNNDKCVEALQFIKDLKWKYCVLPENNLLDLTQTIELYATGKAAMMMHSPASVITNVSTYDTDINNIGAMSLPAGPKKNVTLMGGSVRPIKADSTDEQIDGCIRFLESEGYGFKLTEKSKKNIEDTINKQLEDGLAVGCKGLSVWQENAECEKYRNELIEQKANVNVNHFKLYNDSLTDSNILIQPEEPMYAQELYGLFDNCIQQVLTDKNADCKTLIAKAAKDFQENYLNNEN